MECRLQNVTIEDVKDEDSDTTPRSLINGDEDKLIRDFSFNSDKSSNKMSTKVKVLGGKRWKNYEVITVLQNHSIRNSL